jgi:hypothetical protein
MPGLFGIVESQSRRIGLVEEDGGFARLESVERCRDVGGVGLVSFDEKKRLIRLAREKAHVRRL